MTGASDPCLPEGGAAEAAEAEALAAMGALAGLPPRAGPVVPWPEEVAALTGIAGRFRQVVAAVPGAVAIWTADRQITYAALDRMSDGLAAQLLEQGLGAGVPVALGSEEPIGHVVGALAILKAGGVCVPVFHGLPAERKAMLLETVAPALAVATSAAEAEGLGPSARILAALGGEAMMAAATVPQAMPAPAAEAAAFILFTSGSTGTPKGVAQSHANLLRNTAWQSRALAITCEDRFSQLHAEGTMGALRAMLNALLNGAVLCPFGAAAKDLRAFGDWIGQARPTVLHSAASFFRIFARDLSRPGQFAPVRLMILGGEAVTGDDFDLFRQRFDPASHLCTGLGSTETTTVRMMCLPHGARPGLLNGRLPLGFAVPGTRLDLVDSAPDAALGGHLGEMALHSTTLFPGYWPLTAPPGTGPRQFRMGDLALRRADGVLYHMGRKDQQVKVNGQRVDLIEIEQAALRIHGVAEACVLAQAVGGSNTRLVLFLRRQDPAALTVFKVRYFLRRWLPAAMQPSGLILLDDLPRSAGGKIDRARLRQIAERQAGRDPLADLRQGRSGVDAALLDCFAATSYPFLRNFAADLPDKASFDRIDLTDLQIDSLSLLEICINIETRFGRKFDPEGLLALGHYGRVLKEVARG